MNQKFKTILFASCTIFIAFSLILFPDQALEASIRGLSMWWDVVFPSLLPFFITAELLLAFGVVRFLGVLFEPIMRPLFNVPGAGSFAWLMGMASGYPTGAKIAVKLREENQISRIEAERLVSFTNASSPLFIFGAVSVGFFHDVQLGVLLAISHYLGNTLVGICMGFYKKRESFTITSQKSVSIKNAFRQMHRARLNDRRPFGQILGDAVINSIQTLVMVGGFIILFSVLIKLFYLTHITGNLSLIFKYIFSVFSIPIDFALPFLSGFFEITTGIQLISHLSSDSFLAAIVLTSFILGFNGFSVQAQVGSIISHTDIRFYPYFISRILHGLLASLLTLLLYRPLYVNRQPLTVDGFPVISLPNETDFISLYQNFAQFGPVITLSSISLVVFLLTYRQIKKMLLQK